MSRKLVMETTEKLVPRFMAATPEGRGEVYAFVIRDGLAIHQHPNGPYALSAVGCGYRICRFDSVAQPEAMLLEIAPLTDWATVGADDVPPAVQEQVKAAAKRHQGFA